MQIYLSAQGQEERPFAAKSESDFMKQYIVRRPRKEEEKPFGDGDLIVVIPESDLDFYIQSGWKVDLNHCSGQCQVHCPRDKS